MHVLFSNYSFNIFLCETEVAAKDNARKNIYL